MKNKIIIQDGVARLSKGRLSISHNELNKGLATKILYWDNIINLKSTFIKLDDSDIVTLLKSEKIFEDVYYKSSEFGPRSSVMEKSITDKMMELLLDKTINYIADNLTISAETHDNKLIQNGGSILQMINVLPTPDDDTDIHKILEFRLKRKDHLRNLLNHINSLEIRVSNSENQAHELKKALNEIDIASSELTRLYKENIFKLNYSNIKFNFNMKEIIAVSAAVYGGSSILLPQSAAAVSGVLAGAASVIKWEDAISLRNIDKKSPFNYSAMISRDFM
ncbi:MULTISPECIES: DUF6236 family protein [Klebsiella]|nr:DUF6236 family protein [Klebsiella pneumoniae]MBG2717218.1 hypothetical protein [Klebsiella michiganensis]HBM3141815.1 hypothetical protein [Klebsiella oxytoca]HDU4740306.1 hypothetical protein [Klebsiella pneumoniae subsp. ozaenae]AVW78016.1 hypothetical protein B7D34_22185 [Klebsiella pneumoniae]EIW8566323.1 hypothetical protein [Klebsiella pneumoniae]